MMPSSTPEQTAFLGELAVRDTGDPALATRGGTAFREYVDNSHEFQDYLRSLFYAHQKREGFDSSDLPIFKKLGNEFQLRLRDCFRNENRIVFFRQAVNRRRVTSVSGHERYMEWVGN